MQGFAYEEKRTEFYDALKKQSISLKGARTLDISQRRIPIYIGPGSVPDTGFGS